MWCASCVTHLPISAAKYALDPSLKKHIIRRHLCGVDTRALTRILRERGRNGYAHL